MKISIVIPTFNRQDIIAILLTTLRDDALSLASAEIEVIVADDCSTDDTWKMIARDFPEVILVKGPGKNPPYAKRAAIEVATGDYIVSLDDDSIPRPGWIANAIPTMERGEKIIQSKLVFIDQGQLDLRDESRKHFRVGFRFDGMPLAILNGGFREQYINLCHEFGVFISRDVLKRLPFDDPNMRTWGEAASFYLRIKALGYRVFFQPAIVIDHLGALHGGCKERDKKEPPKKHCTAYVIGMVECFMLLARMRRTFTIPLLVPYYIAGGFFLSLKQRRLCIKYFLVGLWRGFTRKFEPVVPYHNIH